MTVLSSIPTSVYVYLFIILLLLIIDIVLTVLSLKVRKRVKIKKDFLNLSNNEEINDVPVNEEIMAIFNQMEEDSKLEPEEVVQKFEDEQERNAIISYQELVDSVKNSKIDIIEDDNGEVDFVKQLELEFDEPVVSAVESIDNSIDDSVFDVSSNINNNIELQTSIIEDDNTPSHKDIVDELNDDKKFKTSEIISPVFGRITNFTNYNLNKENTVEIKQVAGTSPEEEIKKNEAFLKALIEFRNNL